MQSNRYEHERLHAVDLGVKGQEMGPFAADDDSLMSLKWAETPEVRGDLCPDDLVQS